MAGSEAPELAARLVEEVEAVCLMLGTEAEHASGARGTSSSVSITPQATWAAICALAAEPGACSSEMTDSPLHVRVLLDDGCPAVQLTLIVPPGYPGAEAGPLAASVSCIDGTLGATAEEQLLAAGSKAAESLLGSEAMWPVVEAIRAEAAEAAERVAERDAAAAAAASAVAAGAVSEARARDAPQRAWMWFHHIKSPTKKRHIVDWGRELGLVGLCKPGYPGVLIVQGGAAACAEYASRLRALRWKAMAVRAEETLVGEGSATEAEEAFVAAAGSVLGAGAGSCVELLEEGELGRVADVMEALGRGEMFRSTILKISPA